MHFVFALLSYQHALHHQYQHHQQTYYHSKCIEHYSIDPPAELFCRGIKRDPIIFPT
jgi:hypothetical protein